MYRQQVQWNTLSVEGRRHIGTRLSVHDIEKVTKQNLPNLFGYTSAWIVAK